MFAICVGLKGHHIIGRFRAGFAAVQNPSEKRFKSEGDEQFYKIAGIEERAVAGAPKFGKNGIHLSAALLKSYGFNPGVSFKFSAPEAGKIILEKI